MRTYGVTEVTILGGSAAVPASAEGALYAAGVAKVNRYGGGNRYETASIAIDALIARYQLSPTLFGVASAINFPDALSGGAAIGNRGGVLLLTAPDGVAPAVSTNLTRFKANKPSLEFLGGTAAVTDATEASIRRLLQ